MLLRLLKRHAELPSSKLLPGISSTTNTFLESISRSLHSLDVDPIDQQPVREFEPDDVIDPSARSSPWNKKPPYRIRTPKQEHLEDLVLGSVARLIPQGSEDARKSSWANIAAAAEILNSHPDDFDDALGDQEIESSLLLDTHYIENNDDDDDLDELDRDFTMIPISEGLLEQHLERAKRKTAVESKIIPPEEQVYQFWVDKHEADLQRFRLLCQDLGLNDSFMVRALFALGKKGRHAMLPVPLESSYILSGPAGAAGAESMLQEIQNADPEHGTDSCTSFEEETDKQESTLEESADTSEELEIEIIGSQYLFGETDSLCAAELHLDAWQQVLEENGLRLNLTRLLRKWPAMLIGPPKADNVRDTLKLLTSMFEGGRNKMQDLVIDYPVVLSYSVMGIQHQLLFLSIHCPGILSDIMAKSPELIATPRIRLEKNVQHLSQYTSSVHEFTNLVKAHPRLLRKRDLIMNTDFLVHKLSQILPPGISGQRVIKSHPAMLTTSVRQISRGWTGLQRLIENVEPWKKEIEVLLREAAAETLQATPLNALSTYIPNDDDDDLELDEEESLSPIPPEKKKDSACSVLGNILLAAPRYHWRVRFLLDLMDHHGLEDHDLPPLVEVLAVSPEVFSVQHPGFDKWNEEDKAKRIQAKFGDFQQESGGFQQQEQRQRQHRGQTERRSSDSKKAQHRSSPTAWNNDSQPYSNNDVNGYDRRYIEPSLSESEYEWGVQNEGYSDWLRDQEDSDVDFDSDFFRQQQQGSAAATAPLYENRKDFNRKRRGKKAAEDEEFEAWLAGDDNEDSKGRNY